MRVHSTDGTFMNTLASTVLALAMAGPALAAPGAAQSGSIAPPSRYAVNSAALATAMTWCRTRHGALTEGSQGAACFSRARGVLAGLGLEQHAQRIDAACSDDATFNTCLTPHIGRLVHALHAEFERLAL
jgi:hypothetical protein